MIGVLFVMLPLVCAIAAMATAAYRGLPCDGCGTCTHCTGLTMDEMIRARVER